MEIFIGISERNSKLSNFMKNIPVGAELFHVDRQTDRHNEANSLFSQFANASKNDFDARHSLISTS